MPSSSQVLSDFCTRNNQQTVKAAARLDKKKTDIIAYIEQEIPLSLVDISKKFNASYRTVVKAFARWGYDPVKLAKDVNHRKIKNRVGGRSFSTVKELLDQKDMVLDRLEKAYPDRFIDICVSMNTTPLTIKKIMLDDGLDLTPIIAAARKRRGRPQVKEQIKPKLSLLNKKW